jgi:AcrR family transcriptional regulator
VDVLLKATARVLVKHGYEGLNTNRIAEVAGVSVGSVYQYFPNKEALVVRVMERHHEKIRAIVIDHLSRLQEATLETVVATLVRAMLDAHRVEPKLHQVFMEQVPRLGALKRLRDQHAAYEPLVTAWLEAHQEQIGVDDPRAATWLLIAAVDGVLNRVVTERPSWLGEAQLEREISSLITRYLSRTAASR